MFIDLVSSLRCLTPHEDSWLVAVTRRMVGRSIVEGTLGCPVCRREYPIVGGVAHFGVEVGTPGQTRSAAATDDDGALRLAALLGLQSPGGIVVLCGAWARLALPLGEIAPVSRVLVNPPGDVEAVGQGIAALRTADGAIPLAAASARGVALDADAATTMDAALRVLAGRARLVAPARLPLPADVDELARDDSWWVAESRVAGSAPIGITRGARPIR